MKRLVIIKVSELFTVVTCIFFFLRFCYFFKGLKGG